MHYCLVYVVDGINRMDISREKNITKYAILESLDTSISSDEKGMDHAKSITK